MNFKKVFSAEMERCYSVACMQIGGVPCALFSTEGRNGGCIAADCLNFGAPREILSGPGGTMGMVPLPGRTEEAIFGVRFYSLANWEEAGTAWLRRGADGSFGLQELYATPYLHRFDVIRRGGVSWFIGCVLAAHKTSKEDFSQPGFVFAAPLPDEPGQPLQPRIICQDLFHNHGYERVQWEGIEASAISSDSGVFVLIPPEKPDGEWETRRLLDRPTSDIAMIDLDGDGEKELATIEAFHGCHYRIYKKRDGRYVQVYEHPEISEFYHVAASGTVFGQPTFIGGCRRGRQQLFLVQWNKNGFETSLVEEQVGPSNAMLAHIGGRELLISANREKAEAAIYEILP